MLRPRVVLQLPERLVEVGARERARRRRVGTAVEARAANAVRSPVHLDDLARSGLAMQTIDVLRDEQERAPRGLPALERDERVMRGVRPRADRPREAARVPAPRGHGIAVEEAPRP